MKSRIVPAWAAVFFAAALPALSIPELEQGYLWLSENNHAGAREVFSAYALNPEPPEDALLGLALCDWAEGSFPAMAGSLARLIEAYPDSPFLPAYLAMMDAGGLQGLHPKERLEALAAASRSAVHAERVAEREMEARGMLLDPAAAESARNAGVLLDQWRVAGLFGRSGARDMIRRFGPERGMAESWDGWLGEARVREVTPVNHIGWVDLDGFFHPRAGIAYAFNAVESRGAGEAWLTVESPSDVRVWWDGQPVLEKTRDTLDESRKTTVRVPLREGKILLAVKCAPQGEWRFRASLQPTREGAPDWMTVPLDTAQFADFELVPFERKFTERPPHVPVHSEYPVPLPEPEFSYDGPLADFLLAVWHAERHEHARAIELLQSAAGAAPDFALIHSLIGETALERAKIRPGSKARFQQEAETAFNKALELDPRSKSALLGLVSYYIDRDQTDQAYGLLEERLDEYPSLGAEGYTGLVEYTRGLLLSRKGFETEAARLFEKAAGEFLPSHEIPRRLYEFHSQNHAVKKAAAISAYALDRFPANLTFLNQAARLDPEIADAPDAVPLLRRALDMFPHSLEYGMALGRALEHRGETDEALSLYEQLAERFPNHPQPMEQHADLATLTEGKVALKTYDGLHREFPMRQKPFRMLRDAGGRSDFAYQQYDVRLEDVDQSVADRWTDSRADAVYLLDIMVLQLYPGGTYDQYIHQALRILNQEGVNEWSEIAIPGGGNIELLEARTLTPDGREWAVTNIQESGGRRSVSMYGIEEGAIVEYAYLERAGRLEPGSNVYAGGYFFGTVDDHMLLSKLTIVRHRDVPFHMDANPESLPVTIEEKGEWIVYDWEQWLSEGVRGEDYAPTLSLRVPSLQVTTAADWIPFADRVRATMNGFEEKHPAIESLANELGADLEDKYARVEAVHDWINQNIEESGGGETTADAAALRTGNRFLKIRLARQLLDLMGVETRLAIAIENDEGDGFRPLPFPNYPGASLLIVPEQEGMDRRAVIDFGSRYAPMTNTLPQIRERVALVYDGPAPWFEPVEPDLWDRGLILRRASLTVGTDGAADVKGEYVYDYGYGRQIREAAANPEVIQRLADSQLSNDLRGVRIDDYSLDYLDDLDRAPALRFEGEIPDILIPAGGGEQTIKSVLVPVNAASLVSDATRQSPAVFESSPVRDRLELRLSLEPLLRDNAKIQLPEDVLYISEFGYYALFHAWEGNDAVIRRSMLVPAQEIDPEAYPRFAEFCRQIDEAEERPIRVRPGAEEPK